MTKEEKILGAIARGWCHPETEDRIMDPELAEAIAQEITLELQGVTDLLYRAWGVIANAGRDITNEGNGWENESEEWRQGAVRWRNDFHELLQEIIHGNSIRED